MERYLAFDCGAGSSRAYLGDLSDGQLRIEEIARIPNEAVQIGGHLYWDVPAMFGMMLEAMEACANDTSNRPSAIGIDTWGVDFGLVDDKGELLGLPHASRDIRTRGMKEDFLKLMPADALYRTTGQALGEVRTVFQLYSMVRSRDPRLSLATSLLFMPDIFAFYLTGQKKTEFSVATGSLLFNILQREWDTEILSLLGLPSTLMQEVVAPGTIIGHLSSTIAEQTGLSDAPVVAGVTHDTGAAVAAVPAEDDNFAYISSGTMSLIGIESPEPVISDAAYNGSFANQGGAFGTYRVIRNIQGLWLLQECQREWARTNSYSTEELCELADDSPRIGAVVDSDSPGFLKPPSMPLAVQEFCRHTGQPVPEGIGPIVRTILESLAIAYAYTMEQLAGLNVKTPERLHIVGGGARNTLLCQLAADATGLPVHAGPVEAAAIGNVLMQARALGSITSLAGLRRVVRDSFGINIYEPRRDSYWDGMYATYKQVRQDTVLY